MLSLLARRLGWLVPIWFAVTLLVFGALRAAPGDPAEVYSGEARLPAVADRSELAREFRARHLLDQPLWRQYLHYLGPFRMSADGHAWFGGSGTRPYGGIVCLDFGDEYQRPGVHVADELARRLRTTVPLAAAALLIAFGGAIPWGALAARRRGSRFDRASGLAAFVLGALPTFWAGLLLVLVCGPLGCDILPVVGIRSNASQHAAFAARAWDVVLHALLPVLVLAYGSLAYLSRQMRSALIDALGSDYVRAARARGLSETRVLWSHALRNAILPLVTLAAGALPFLVGGSVIVEAVFGLPGIGAYAYDGLLARDYNVVMATTTLSAALTLAGVLVSDLLVMRLDPRVRHA
jgi:peptide/nickel transport system permease protein